jgi:hypothetical protein
MKIEIDEWIGDLKRKHQKHQIWFINHIWFKRGEAGKGELGMRNAERKKLRRWGNEKVGKKQD